MRVIAFLLIALGLVGLLYGGFSWTRHEKVVDIGPLQVTNEEQKSLPVPPIVGGVLFAVGIVLLMKSGRTA